MEGLTGIWISILSAGDGDRGRSYSVESGSYDR